MVLCVTLRLSVLSAHWTDSRTEESVEQEEVMVICPARSQSTTPTSQVMGRPGLQVTYLDIITIWGSGHQELYILSLIHQHINKIQKAAHLIWETERGLGLLFPQNQFILLFKLSIQKRFLEWFCAMWFEMYRLSYKSSVAYMDW